MTRYRVSRASGAPGVGGTTVADEAAHGSLAATRRHTGIHGNTVTPAEAA
jgi:hypothetical protein